VTISLFSYMFLIILQGKFGLGFWEASFSACLLEREARPVHPFRMRAEVVKKKRNKLKEVTSVRTSICISASPLSMSVTPCTHVPNLILLAKYISIIVQCQLLNN
jgi:hypothetical protein